MLTKLLHVKFDQGNTTELERAALLAFINVAQPTNGTESLNHEVFTRHEETIYDQVEADMAEMTSRSESEFFNLESKTQPEIADWSEK